jgi:hypothetical protein
MITKIIEKDEIIMLTDLGAFLYEYKSLLGRISTSVSVLEKYEATVSVAFKE